MQVKADLDFIDVKMGKNEKPEIFNKQLRNSGFKHDFC